MDEVDGLVSELDKELIAAFQFDKDEIRTIKKIALETENVLGKFSILFPEFHPVLRAYSTDKKQHQLTDLYMETKKLTQELELLEKQSADMKSVLDALRVEEVGLHSMTS